MAVKGKSARGVVVDFDLLKIKEQMAAAPASIDVQKRQDFVEGRRRRARKKVPQELLDNITPPVEVEKELPAVETEAAAMIDEVVEEVVVEKKAPKTKQKARPASKDKTEK